MLGRLILLLLQIVIAWFLAPEIAKYIPVGDPLERFVFAVICAIIVFLVGVLAAQVLRDVGQPGSATLTWCLILALVAAAIATWGPDLVPQIPWGRIPDRALVLAGAVLGYLVKK
jgi:Na+/H+-dicarboxylate symporter